MIVVMVLFILEMIINGIVDYKTYPLRLGAPRAPADRVALVGATQTHLVEVGDGCGTSCPQPALDLCFVSVIDLCHFVLFLSASVGIIFNPSVM